MEGPEAHMPLSIPEIDTIHSGAADGKEADLSIFICLTESCNDLGLRFIVKISALSPAVDKVLGALVAMIFIRNFQQGLQDVYRLVKGRTLARTGERSERF